MICPDLSLSINRLQSITSRKQLTRRFVWVYSQANAAMEAHDESAHRAALIAVLLRALPSRSAIREAGGISREEEQTLSLLLKLLLKPVIDS